MGPSAQVEANKANIRRYVDEALNRGILDVIDETRGELAEHAKDKVRAWRTAFPDFHTTIETLVARGRLGGVQRAPRGDA